MVSLDVPVAEQVTSALLIAVSSTAPAPDVSMESRLDELLGSPTDRSWAESETQTAVHVDVIVDTMALGDIGNASASTVDREVPITASDPREPTNASRHDASAEAIGQQEPMTASPAEPELPPPG